MLITKFFEERTVYAYKDSMSAAWVIVTKFHKDSFHKENIPVLRLIWRFCNLKWYLSKIFSKNLCLFFAQKILPPLLGQKVDSC